MAVRISQCTALLIACLAAMVLGQADRPSWLQWAHDGQHTGSIPVAGQSLIQNEVDIVYDPLVSQEQAGSGGDLLVHYQVPLVDEEGNVYMEFKSGAFDPGATVFSTQIWSEKKLTFARNYPIAVWSFDTDWTPPGSYRDLWEPVL